MIAHKQSVQANRHMRHASSRQHWNRFLYGVTLILLTCGFVTSSWAAVFTLAVGDAWYVGMIYDGIPASEALQVGYINHLITLAPGAPAVQLPAQRGEIYNRLKSSLSDPLPPAQLTGGVKNSSGANTGINVTEFAYILGKYDGPNYGTEVWYVPSLTTVNLPAKLGGKKNSQYGLSHYSLFRATENLTRPVPDTGSTLLLLCVAVLTIESLRRKLRCEHRRRNT